MFDRFSKSNIYFILLLGLVITALLLKFNSYTQNYFIQNNKIQEQFNDIKNAELNLKYNVLVASLYMYTDNDKIIKSVDKLQKDINILLNNKYFEIQYPYIYKRLKVYKININKKIDNVYDFMMLNSGIKNSIMYLADLLDRLPKISAKKLRNKKSNKYFKKNNFYAQKIIDVISSVFLARSSFDNDFVKHLDISFFENYKTDYKPLIKYNTVFLANLKIFKKFFPKYVYLISNINNAKSKKELNKINNEFLQCVNNKIIIIKYVSYLLILFVLFSVLSLVFMIKKLNKEYIKLQRANNALKHAYITDKLTDLYNRNKFNEDMRYVKNPVLILININRFKHYNDYYGIKVGDEILKKVARIIECLIPSEIYASLYRLGADDYGILYEYKRYEDIAGLARKIINYFNVNEIEINQIKFNISVSIGISRQPPYIENADIALKEVKKSPRFSYMIYDEKLKVKERIEQNLIKTKILYKAINENRIVPYFQAIVDNKTKKTVKYEVLARLIHKNGKVESIYPYLQIAKENKLYSDITKIIIKKTYDKFKNSNIHFSVNVSIEDMMDINVIKFLYKYYLKNKEMAKRATFEILESEAINDYESIKTFVDRVKKIGAKVAIDDFGSGYSNFEHLLNLNVDYMKIDGSLISNIAKSKEAFKIVKVLKIFSKEINVKSIAEFVENEEIYKRIYKLGIDYSQGYYFSKPSPDFT